MNPTKPSEFTRDQILTELRRSLEIEGEGIRSLLEHIRQDGGDSVDGALRLMFQCSGKVVVTGVGKSGHVGQKIAATLASTGTPAFFLHPVEAIHGDLGMVSRMDVIVALSNSGQTEELLRLLGPIRRMGLPIIAMTGNPESELARRADIHINVAVPREACPHNLAPTASTTALLAMGDALSVCLLSMKNFKPEDYALFHPGGNLGKKLMTTAGDLMQGGTKLPAVPEDATVSAAVKEIQDKQFGVTAVIDSMGRLSGAFSLGDLMRLHVKDPSLSFLKEPISKHMSPNPRVVSPEVLAARALNLMETLRIRALFVMDEQKVLLGVIGIYEVLEAIDY
ncbi:MAG: KpsF/GutQ family sugar-phosphate isomerase [Deltaproteobacteria bacterium]|nr:KpsF/GutQ family sugar-phosphate isomerase [Deltaproteobacteria bacterium]